MARKYGGLTGTKRSPSPSAAPGSWIEPTEGYREQTGSSWPFPSPIEPQSFTGAVVLALSSGTADVAVASSGYLRCDGSAINRTTYSGLFSVLNTTYGPGNNTTTFNIPKYFDGYIYFKGATTSGTYPLGSGQLSQSHSHNFANAYYDSIGPFDRNPSEGPRTEGTGNFTTLNGSVEGQAIQNELRKRECIPLITVKDAALIPPGSAVALFYPAFNGANISIPSQYVIASGQELNRAAYPDLFNNLGTLYGSGNGSTTFNIPDLRGIFLSGPRGSLTAQVSGVIAPSGFLPDTFAYHFHTFRVETNQQTGGGGGGTTRTRINAVAFSPASEQNVGSSESRSNNMSVIWCLVTTNSAA